MYLGCRSAFYWPLALLLLCPAIVRADSWAGPSTKVQDSAKGEYRFSTFPPGFAGNPEKDRKKAMCFGRLEQKQKDGKSKTIWEKQLSNAISPVSVLVSDGGKYVVTFDNWHSMGHGNNAVVIYGPQGKLVRELSLTDFLTKEEFSNLPMSVSSIWWGSGHELDEKTGCVVLKVTRESNIGNKNGEKKPKEVRLELETGKVVGLEKEKGK